MGTKEKIKPITTEDAIIDIRADYDNKVNGNSDVPVGYVRLPVGGAIVKINKDAVPALTLDAIAQRFPDPPVPVEVNKQKEREEENPNHPDYLAEMAKMANRRGTAMIECMVMFVVELHNDIPAGDIEKLELLGLTTGSDSATAIEYKYKKHILFSNEKNINFLTLAVGVSQEAINKASATFRG